MFEHPGRTANRTARRLRAVSALVALSLAAALAACSSSPSTGAGASSHSTLIFADVAPFSGVDAALGPIYLVSCTGATNAINAAGGILGHKVACMSKDTPGEPADALPAVGSLLANTQNLDLVIGCTSNQAASAVPLPKPKQTHTFLTTGHSYVHHV